MKRASMSFVNMAKSGITKPINRSPTVLSGGGKKKNRVNKQLAKLRLEAEGIGVAIPLSDW